MKKLAVVFLFVFAAHVMADAPFAFAHRDAMDGPVVNDCRAAIDRGDVTPVLKWADKKYEAVLRAAFEKTMAVRKLGAEAKELADTYFMETAVRLHRASEGMPYAGLKPAGTRPQIVFEADKALLSGSPDAILKAIDAETAAGLRTRFADTLEKMQNMDRDVELGREFVKSYIEYMHYVEQLHRTAGGEYANIEEHEEALPSDNTLQPATRSKDRKRR